MGDGLRWHSSHGEERTEQASSPLRHELSTMCSGPTCSAILLPSFPPHPRTPSHGEGSARTWSTRPYRYTDASEWSRWDVHDQKGSQKNGRAQVCNPVNNQQLVLRIQLSTKNTN